MKLSRREVLLALAASGCDPNLSPETPAADGFPCGVASGDVTAERAVLWTVFDGTTPLSLEWWPLDDTNAVQRRDDVSVASDGTARVDVSGLTAGARYGFRFTDGSRTSDEGHFRAALAANALEPLTFGVASCARQTVSLAPMATVAEQYPLDAFLCLGDAVYADGAETRAEYAQKWRSGFVRRPNRLMRAATSTIATWDDHEVRNDASDTKVMTAQLDVARDAFLAWQPVRPEAPSRIWRSFKWGRTAELFVLDCRGERNHAASEYISEAQLQWLEDGLAKSDAVFKLVLNSVPVSSYPAALFQAFNDDRWEGFPAQRQRLLEFVDAHRDGVLWLTGDFHIGVAGRVALEGVGAQQVELACGPAGSNAPNPALTYPKGPQFDFASATNNVVVLDLDPATRAAKARFVAGDGKVLFEKTYVL